MVRRASIVFVLAQLAIPCLALAQVGPPGPPKLGPSNSTDLAVVITQGNSKSASIGLRNVYQHRWPNKEIRWESGWVRVASRDGNRYALGTSGAFRIVEPETVVGSERLFSKFHHQHQLSTTTDWFTNFDAARDKPSGLVRQFVLATGVGTTWFQNDRTLVRTAYGLEYTEENLDVQGANRFAGYRLSYRMKAPFAAASTVESELTMDGSFHTANDVRVDWLNGVAVAINARLALKSSIRLLFRNLPALQTLDLRSPEGALLGRVEVEKDQFDTSFTNSLVITF